MPEQRETELLDEFFERVGTNWSFDPLRDPNWHPTREDYASLCDAFKAALAASQEKERLLIAAGNPMLMEDRSLCFCRRPLDADWNGEHDEECAAARDALASAQTHGGSK